MKRRQLLQAAAAGWLVDQCLPSQPNIVGQIVGANHRAGHLLRSGQPTTADGPAEQADVVIVGSGISGASAAWRLASLGVEVTMLELESRLGGTSGWGDNGVVAHPWGAHYLPIPELDARAVRRLLGELDIITGYDAAGRPLLREEMLCHAPEERLFYQGAWHAGLIPYGALSSYERREIDRFRGIKYDLLDTRGNDGRYVFSLPCESSSRDPAWRELDSLSMHQWLERQGFSSDFLRWFVSYATLDDFGSNLHDVSAWAGLHYFAARRLETDQTEGSRYLVWPEGNGYLARALLDKMHGSRQSGALVTELQPRQNGRVRLSYLNVADGTRHQLDARAVVLAVPGFIAERLLARGLAGGRLEPQRASSPWLVANLHVNMPANANRAWDSMIYGGRGLGCVDAGHQRMSLQDQTVLTYFRAFGDADVAASRRWLLGQSWADLASDVLADLRPAYPLLAEQCERLDIMLWGHAMPRPRPGFLTQPAGEPLVAEGVAWAHVDQSGMALFEEANLRGVRAAEAVAGVLGIDSGESWT